MMNPVDPRIERAGHRWAPGGGATLYLDAESPAASAKMFVSGWLDDARQTGASVLP